MLHIVWSQVARRRGRSLAVVAAIVVAAVSFSLLTSAVASSRLEVKGKVTANFRSAYDILVRPPHSITPLERSDRLVQENYLSGIFGGITMQQYHLIKQLSGVQVAAPIAMVGYTLPVVNLRYAINKYVDPTRSQQLLRVDFRWTSDRGLTHTHDATRYFFVTKEPLHHGQALRDPVTGHQIQVTSAFDTLDTNRTSAFQNPPNLIPFSTTRPGRLAQNYGLKPGQIGSNYLYQMPLMIAAVDPKAEAELVGLKQAVTSGRYLTERDHITHTVVHGNGGRTSLTYRQVPMLMSGRLTSDEHMTTVVSTVDTGIPDDQLPGRLAAKDGPRWVTHLPFHVVHRTRHPGNQVYRQLLRTYSRSKSVQYSAQYWSAGQVDYRRGADGHLQPRPRTNNRFTWTDSTSGFFAPPEAGDIGFRKLIVAEASNQISPGNVYYAPEPQVVGQFDPHRIEGFSKLSQVPLTTYYPPAAAPADPRAARLLHGQSLLPNNNLAGYLQQPPLLLTNLRSLPAFYDSQAFTPLTNGEMRGYPTAWKAPISVIRVRVAGVTGADDASRERVRLVAEQIARRTGLDVDITIGTSPTPQLIDLPAGNAGRPAMTLREGWVKKGVAVQLLSAIDTKSLLLFGLVLLVCALFLLNAVTAAVRSRTAELGILSCLGWSSRRIFWLLEIELLVTGLVAGLVGTAIAMALVGIFDLHVAWQQLLLITPVAVLLAGVAGLAPTRRASRAVPMQAIQPAVRAPRRALAVTSVTRLGLVGVSRTPGRSLLAAASLFIGVAALAGLLAIQQEFSQHVVGTLLGNVVAIQVRGVDLLAVALVLGLGAFTIADVAYLNISERRAEIGTLRATGWTEHHVQRLFATEALVIAAVGAVAGALLGVTATGVLLHADVLILGRAAGLAASAGRLAAVVALVVPLVRLGHLAPAGLLHD
ncbi:ABC transporter permease [Nocardioides cynanchi]|uniref:ABC transporter permease n=1 Tax=Nocardioides cynanchi TaxID=2558918 RepID=UPI001245F102|nr:FtsX-like permease family protein [Nocardioides cynanchi]